MEKAEKARSGRSNIRYDLLGSTAIIEFKGTRGAERKAGEQLMKFDQRIKTVLAKAGPVSGEYRIRKLRHVCGVKKYMVEYRENGCTFRFDPRKTFFSSRLSFERSRILKLSKDGERVVVMFAGAGPFAIEIAKKNKLSEVVGIEINPYACVYMIANAKSNKVSNLTVEKGDVRKFAKKYHGYADRIIMPLPWSSMEFLDEAATMASKEATIHLYLFGKTESVLSESKKRIRDHARKNKYKVSFISDRVVRTYSASEVEMAIDYILKKSA